MSDSNASNISPTSESLVEAPESIAQQTGSADISGIKAVEPLTTLSPAPFKSGGNCMLRQQGGRRSQKKHARKSHKKHARKSHKKHVRKSHKKHSRKSHK